MKHIVFISYFFPPNTEIASERALRYVKSLTKIADKVTVITLDLSTLGNEQYRTNIDRLASLDLKKVEFKFVKPRFKFLIWFGKKQQNNKWLNILSRVMYKILNQVILADALGFTWNGGLRKLLNRELKKSKVDLIVTTVSPFSSMYVIAKFANCNNIRYIIDYRDLWLSNPHLHLYYFASKIALYKEKYAVSNAYRIITVSNGLAEYFRANYEFGDRVIVLYNIADESVINCYNQFNRHKVIQNDGMLNLFFAGTLYNSGHAARRFDVFIEALSFLSQDIRQKIKIHFYGNAVWLKAQFNNSGCGDNLIYHDRVSKEIILSKMGEADVLISLINNMHYANNPYENGIMSAKIFEYIITNKPIINISNKDAEINEFMRTLNYEYFYSCSSRESRILAKYLEKLLELKYKQNMESKKSNLINWEQQFSQKFINEV